jgi:xanthine dehydrogenase small subunit
MPGIEFLLNGRGVRAEGLPPQTTLLDFVRSQGLTGAKEGCAEGECGACTVLMVREHGAGSAYVPINSCLLFLPMAAGQEIYTVEALAEGGRLTQVQREIAGRGGSQCGYCTPGFVMSLFAEQYRPDREGPCDVQALGGNLCRCTGYRPIRDAAPGGWRAARGIASRSADAARAGNGPRSFRWASRAPPRSPNACRRWPNIPARAGGSGGTDLAVESNLRLRRFPHLISLEALERAARVCESAANVELGAGLSLNEMECAAAGLPAFHEWLPLFASPLIRNRATLGGNLATASPIGDAAPLLLALDARVRIAGAGGERIEPLDSGFFTGYRKTALKAR